MYIFRTDGNSVIGMGHVMRCLAIAAAMREKPLFVTACEDCLKLIEERGYRFILLPTDYRKMEEELPFLKNIVADSGASEIEKAVFLVDSYQVTEKYFWALKGLGVVACLEDMGKSYPVDLLINYNLYGPETVYAEGLHTLLGVRYVPLRKEFIGNCDYKVREKVKNVLITTGGGDPLFSAAGFLEAFLETEEKNGDGDIIFHVISGPMNRYSGELKAGYGAHPYVRIYENVTDIKEIMCRCDVALTAAGSTVYEISSLGIPMICFYFAENQRRGAEYLAKKTDIVNAGNYEEDATNTINRACLALRRCISEYEYREKLWKQERRLVDGQGAIRIAEELRIAKETV